MAYNRNNRGFDRNNYGGSISRNVDPWDTTNDWGMRSGGGGGGGGNYMGNQNQSNDALALANNLINNILRGNQPPSLLDMGPNDMRGGGGYGGGYGRNMGGGMGGNMGGGGYDRFDDRDRIGRMMGNRNAAVNRNRRPGAVPGRNNKPNKSGGIRKPNAADRTKKVLAKNSNNSKATKPDDDTNKKTESGEKDDAVEGDPTDSAYADVPNDMFYCHLCKKHMWDCLSFENHIKGRSHAMMREGVEESYRLRATMIRQEAKIDEQLKSIEVERLKRIGKNVKVGNVRREYCTMCDLHFYGHLSSHRRSEGHLTLKKFLHPKCSDCSMEFPTRIEYDAHLLAPAHMIKAAKRAHRSENKRNKNQLVIHSEADELKDVREKEEKEKVEKAAGEKTAGGEGDENGENAEGKEGGADESVEGTQAEAVVETEKEADDVILDFIEGVTELTSDIENRIPKYNCHRHLGKSLIHKLDCYECRICNRYFDTLNTAEIHTRTQNHHRQFIKFLNEKCNEVKIAEKRAAATLENERKKRARLEEKEQNGKAAEEKPKIDPSELYDPSEATEDDDKPLDSDNADIKEEESVNTTQESQDVTMSSIKDEEENQDDAAPEQDQEEEEEEEEEIKQPAKRGVAAATKAASPVKQAPAPAAAAAPPAVATPPQAKQSPPVQQKQTAIRGRPAQRGAARGRGARGRYNRF